MAASPEDVAFCQAEDNLRKFTDENPVAVVNCDVTPNVRASAETPPGLQMFIIAPDGAQLAFELSPTRKRAQIILSTPEETMLKQALIGASRPSLAEIFCGDDAELRKVTRFFQPG